MTVKRGPPIFKGRSLGIVLLVAAQVLIGVVHGISGFWLFASSPNVYSTYTIIFGLLTLVFAWGLWQGRRWGWVGTAAVAVFVIVADSLTLLDLPSVPGIPKAAGVGEITYSLFIVVYLIQKQIKK